MGYPAYAKYKSTRWGEVGSLPSEWEARRLKFNCDITCGFAFSSDDFSTEGIPLIRISDIKSTGHVSLEAVKFLPTDYEIKHAPFLIRKGDIVMAMTGATIGKAAVYSDEKPALLNQRACVFRTHARGNQKFLWFVLNSEFYIEHVKLTGFGGAQPNISDFQLLDCFSPYPPSKEKQKIADFLDWKTGQIDELISKKKQLIEKLKEKRIALITRAVTRGLNSDAPMRDSGIPWLGEVPAHWEVKRLRFSISSNPVKSQVAKLNYDLLVSFVPMEAVGEQGGIDLSQEKPIGDVYGGYTYFANGDIVIAKITPCFENGKGAIAEGLLNGVAFGTTEFHVMRPLENVCQRWLFYLSISDAFRKIGASEMLGAGGQKRVPEDFIKDFRTGIPSLPEQRTISDYLDLKNEQTNALIAKNEQLIEKLTEYRTALITAATTGKIDLRNVKIGGAV